MKPLEIIERLIDMVEEGVSSKTIELKMSQWCDFSLREAEKQVAALKTYISKHGKERLLSGYKPEETEKTIRREPFDGVRKPPTFE